MADGKDCDSEDLEGHPYRWDLEERTCCNLGADSMLPSADCVKV